MRTYTGHTNWIETVAFSPQGNIIASGGTDGIRIWNVSDGSQLAYYDQEIGIFQISAEVLECSSMAFSPDGSKFGYGRFDATAVVANNAFYQPQYRIDGQISADGAALSDAIVIIKGNYTNIVTTDATGFYSFPNAVPNSYYTISIYKPGIAFNPTTQVLSSISGNQGGINFIGQTLCTPANCPNSVPTPAQNNSTVPLDGNLTATFASVTTAGNSVATTINIRPVTPNSYRIWFDSRKYNYGYSDFGSLQWKHSFKIHTADEH